VADQLDDRLKSWIGGILDGAEVSLRPPETQTSGRGVGLYLLELLQSSPMSTMKPPPLQLMLRYLVTTWSPQPEEAHETLARLFFAAMENKTFEVEREPPSISLWTALGVHPQPSFILRAPLLQERPQPPAKLVRQPPKVEIVSTISFHGKILGPGQIPLSDCLIEVPSLHLSTSSDHEGRFNFRGLPATGSTKFLIKARGRELAVSSDQNYPDSRKPMVVSFSSMED
jgi:hypothetical protein